MSELPEGVVTCPNCGRQVPAGEFCGICGAHLMSGSHHRLHAFAAQPGEHVFHPAFVSTLFPHLPHRQAAPFRLALVGSAVVMLVLGILGFTAADIGVACMAVPLLYLIYLYEANVYEDEPELVIGATLVLGLIVGSVWTWSFGSYITDTIILNAVSSAGMGQDIVAGALIPLGAAALMLLGPLILYFRKYHEAMDGFTFGAASALGFTLGSNLVELWPQVTAGVTNAHPTLDSALQILARGLLVPFIAGSSTGLVAAALWLRKGGSRGTERRLPWAAVDVPLLIPGVAAMWLILGFVNIYASSENSVLAVYILVSVALLLLVRLSLHRILLIEAARVPVGPPTVCLRCHYRVPAMAFCPHCGVAVSATPKTGGRSTIRTATS